MPSFRSEGISKHAVNHREGDRQDHRRNQQSCSDFSGRHHPLTGRSQLDTTQRLVTSNHPLERAADRLATTALNRDVLRSDEFEHHSPSGSDNPHFTRGNTTDDGPFGRSIERFTGGGRPLPNSIQSGMERAFGTAFDDVRIHDGPAASILGEMAGAEAFAHGRHIVYNDVFRPTTNEGRRLLAHELAHVLQWRTGTLGGETIARVSDGTGRTQSDGFYLFQQGITPSKWQDIRNAADSVDRAVAFRTVRSLIEEYSFSPAQATDIVVWYYKHKHTASRVVAESVSPVGWDDHVGTVLGAYVAETIRSYSPHVGHDHARLERLVTDVNALLKSGHLPDLHPVLPYQIDATLTVGGESVSIEPTVDSGGFRARSTSDISLSKSLIPSAALQSQQKTGSISIEQWRETVDGDQYRMELTVDGMGSQNVTAVVIDDEDHGSTILNRWIYSNHVLIGANRGIAIRQFTNTTSEQSNPSFSGVSYMHLPGDHSYIPVKITASKPTQSENSKNIQSNTSVEGTFQRKVQQSLTLQSSAKSSVERNLLVDTGADVSTLHWKIAQRAGITSIDHSEIEWDRFSKFVDGFDLIIHRLFPSVIEDASEQNNLSDTKNESTSREYSNNSTQTQTQTPALSNELVEFICDYEQFAKDGDKLSLITEKDPTIDAFFAKFKEIVDIPVENADLLENIAGMQLLYEDGGILERGNDEPVYMVTFTVNNRAHTVETTLHRDGDEDTSPGAIGQDILRDYLVGPGTMSYFY